MQRLRSLLVGVGGLALGIIFLSIAGTSAQQAPQAGPTLGAVGPTVIVAIDLFVASELEAKEGQ